MQDLTGFKFGQMRVIQAHSEVIGAWICECSCQKRLTAQGSAILAGSVTSCGHLPSADKPVVQPQYAVMD